MIEAERVMSQDDLSVAVLWAVAERPGSSARHAARAIGETRTSVNQVLYGFPGLFRKEGDSPPRWFVIHQPVPSASTPAAGFPVLGPDSGYALDLYLWQAEAMEAWQANGRCGIVEAVTAAGKTRLGLCAIAQAVDEGSHAAVLVPGIELMHQWHRQLEQLLAVPVGLMGDGNKGSLAEYKVIVATTASARANWLDLPAGASGLLVADEVHRFAANVNRLGLEDGFEERLGLSATYERQDGLHEEILLPYFDEVVFTLGYERATREGVIAEVRVAMIGVDLSSEEQEEYEELSAVVSKMTGRLINVFGVPASPYATFIAQVNHMEKHGTRDEGMAAKRYLKAVGERRRLLAETPSKLDAIGLLAGAIEAADRTIVFTTTTNSADTIAAEMDDYGFRAGSHHSKVPKEERKRRLEAFASGELDAIAAARTLNEGIDVPDADLGIIFGGSRQRMEMVQRLGRVLRLKDDDRDARFVVLYVSGSSEDPENGYQEVFIEEMVRIAKAVEYFDMDDDPDDVTVFLAP